MNPWPATQLDNTGLALVIQWLENPAFGYRSETGVVAANRPFARLCGLNLAELEGQQLDELLPGLETIPSDGQVVVSGDGTSYCLQQLPLMAEDVEIYLLHKVHTLKMAPGSHDLETPIPPELTLLHNCIAAVDPFTADHTVATAHLARAVAQQLCLDRSEIDTVFLGGLLHDIGKIRIPAGILNRSGRLSDGEMACIRHHPETGMQILEPMKTHRGLLAVVHEHHERLDGTGYPRGLKGDDICMAARVVAVADVYQSMTSHRPYRAALPASEALEELQRGRFHTYDPDAVDACLTLAQDDGQQPGFPAANH